MDQETLTNQSGRAIQPLRQPCHLPAEIFIEILLLTFPSLWERQAPQLKALSFVCRFWHLIVDSTPALWSRISIADNICYVQKALSKSREHLIDVYGDSIRITPASDWLKASDNYGASVFLAKLQPHARRWRHVILVLPPPEESTPTFTIFPSLQTLELRSWVRFALNDQLLALLNRQHAPFLRELSLRAFRIARWDLISLPPTLSKLQIARIKEGFPFIVGWLSAIRACPNLTVLRFHGPRIWTGDDVKGDEDCIAPAVVELDALRELDLHGFQPDLILDVLKRLVLPDNCSISIRCWLHSPNPSTPFLSPILSSQRNIQRAGKVIQVTFTLQGGVRALHIVYQRLRIYLDLPGAQAIRDALEWFGVRGEDSSFSSSHPESLQVGLATFNSPPITLELGRNWLHRNFTELGAISDLRNISRVEMHSFSDEERRAFLVYLSKPGDPTQPGRTMADFSQTPGPESNQEVGGVWPFPGLSELVRREFKDNVVHRVLVEPLAAAGMSGRATRSELPEPKTPWEKVV